MQFNGFNKVNANSSPGCDNVRSFAVDDSVHSLKKVGMNLNHINVSATVELRADQTLERLEGFLRVNAPQAEMMIALRAPFDIAALNVGLTLQRDVMVRFAPLGEDRRAYAVAWQPVHAGPFPAFAGTLFITTDEASPDESIITLDGHYHPPLGVAGDVFDAIVGRHIAQASATDLLERITLFMNSAAPGRVFA